MASCVKASETSWDSLVDAEAQLRTPIIVYVIKSKDSVSFLFFTALPFHNLRFKNGAFLLCVRRSLT